MAEIIDQLLNLAWSAWRRRAYALIVAWVMCLAGWAMVAMLPDTYRSSTLVHLDTASILDPLLRGLTIDTDVAAEVELMQSRLLSRPNLEKLARSVDLDLTTDDSAEMARVVDSLSNRISMQRQRPDLFRISFEDRDPRRARDVVQNLLNIFVEVNLGRSREDMDLAREFIEDQIRVYEQQLEDAERRLAQFKQDNMGLLGRADGGYQAQLEMAQEAHAQAKSALQDAKLRRDTLRRELQSIPQYLPANTTGTGFGPPSNTEVQILELQRRLEDLLTRYTEKHPDVVIARRKLNALLEQQQQELQAVAELPQAANNELNGSDALGEVNTVYEQLKVQLVEEEARIATLANRVAETRDELNNIQAQAERVPDVEAELVKLNRDYGVLRENYQQLLARREAERISRARDMQAEEIQFQIIEPPEIPVWPSAPNRPLFMSVVLIMGLGSGIGFALVLAYSSNTFTNVGQLKSALALPVLGTVSMSDCGRPSPWVHFNSLVFWICLGALLAVFAGLVLIEVQIGFGQLSRDGVLSTIPAEWLHWLPVS